MSGVAHAFMNFIQTKFKSFTDSFSSGFKGGWKVVTSGWSNGTNSVTTNSASSYPISVVNMTDPNMTISLNTSGAGTGAALWVTDSGNWFAIVSEMDISSGTGNCSSSNPYNPCGGTYAYNPCGGTNPTNPCGTNPVNNCPSTNPVNSCPSYWSNYCGGTNPYTCNPGSGGNCKTTAPYNSYNCFRSGNACGGCTAYNPYVAGNCAGGNCYRTYGCNPATGGNCNPATGGNTIYCGGNCYGTGGDCYGTGGSCASYYDTYPRYLRLIQYASNVLSTVASVTLDAVTSFAEIAGIKVFVTNATEGNSSSATVTARAYSDSSMVTQIGSDLVYNATGVKIIANYGIIASPSNYDQGNTITSISIQ